MCRSRRSARISSIRIWSPTGSSAYTSGCAPRSTRSGSPSSSAANARAAARLPTPGGPCRRYACAGPSASAARRRRFASACSGSGSNASKNRLRQVAGGGRRVEGLDPAGGEGGQPAGGRGGPRPETARPRLDPVGSVGLARGRLGRVEQEQERAVGQERARRVEIQLEDALDAEPARDPLVRERRVDVAVAEDVVARLERRVDDA